MIYGSVCSGIEAASVAWKTLIPYNGKPAKDSPRYRALGNSMAVNCMNWIGHRIQLVNEVLNQ